MHSSTRVSGRDKYGDHDEGTCTKNGGHRTSAHDAVRDLLTKSRVEAHIVPYVNF
jgi:hypothetical protein